MSTITKKETSSELKEKLGQPYVLIVHNDDFNTFDWVIDCLVKICGHEYEQASQVAHIVHFTGRCDVKRGDKETITKMYDGLKSANLSVTMETV